MSSTTQNRMGGDAGSGEFEETLRLIARMAPPEGLEERVQAGLKAAPAAGGARILSWPTALRPGSAWMRSAAAAAIVAMVIGGSWGVYSRVHSIQPVRAITVPLHLSTQGGFSSAGAMRTPQTLNGPMVEHPAAVVAKPATAAPLPENPTVKPALKAPMHPGTTTVAKKTNVAPDAPREK